MWYTVKTHTRSFEHKKIGHRTRVYTLRNDLFKTNQSK